MNQPRLFLPPKRRGLVFHIVLMLLSGVTGGLLFWLAVDQAVGSYFLLLLSISILLLVPLPFLAYRGYSLFQSRYLLDRDGLRLRWGLRTEDIPIPDIEWVRPANQMGMNLPLPVLRTPGVITGTRMIEDLGPVEFFSSDENLLILVATHQKIFVISPENTKSFLSTFSRMIEMGSPTPLRYQSTQPAVLLQNVWTDRLARFSVAGGILLGLLLFLLVAILIPNLSNVPLGYDRLGNPLSLVSSERLLLLPVLAAFSLGFNILAGLFFYRRPRTQVIAYFFWISSSITPFLLIIAILYIL